MLIAKLRYTNIAELQKTPAIYVPTSKTKTKLHHALGCAHLNNSVCQKETEA